MSGPHYEGECLRSSLAETKAARAASFKFRVIAERNEVEHRLVALREFIECGRPWNKLLYQERFRLRRQEKIMTRYLKILNARIGADFK